MRIGNMIGGTDKDFLEIVQKSQARKDDAALRIKYYQDEQGEDTLRLIRQKWSRPEDFRLFCINLVRKLTDKRATVYQRAPVRTFEGMSQDVGEQVYAAMNADVVLKRASRLTKLLKTTALRVAWTGDSPTLHVVTPNILDVVQSAPERPDRVIVTYPGERQTDTRYADWTKTSFTMRDYRGSPIRVEGNEKAINPYGALPFVPVFDRYPDDRFFLPGGDDLIEAQRAVNVALSNLWRAVELQAHGQAWATGVPASDAINVGPDRAITLPENGKFGFASPDAPIKEILEGIQFVLRQTAAANDLSADVFDLNDAAESGSAKAMERADLQETRQDDLELWRNYEAQLFETVKTVVNTHAPGTIPENATVRVDFAEIGENLSQADRLANAEKFIELGLWSPVDAFMAVNPDFGSREQVAAELARRKQETIDIAGIT